MNTIARAEELAAERNISLRRLSQICGVPYSTLLNAKSRSGELTVDTIEKICRGLDMPLWQFFYIRE